MLHLREGADPEQRPAQAGAGAARGEPGGCRTGLNIPRRVTSDVARQEFFWREKCVKISQSSEHFARYT